MFHLAPSQDLAHDLPRGRTARLGEWWPAALIGLVVLTLVNQAGSAQAAQQGAPQGIDLQQAAEDAPAKRWRLADFTTGGPTPLAVGPLSGN